MDILTVPTRNLLFAAMSDEDLALLAPHLSRVSLPVRFELDAPGRGIEWVYFPEDGIVSVISADREGRQCEVGMFGREGMSGSAVVLGTRTSPHHAYMQIAGVSGLCISKANLSAAMRASATLTALLLRYVQAVLVQSESATRAAGMHTIEQRLARCVLMCHDRLAGHEVCLSHDSISMMLGTRRAGVTLALQNIEVKGLIRRLRCSVTVINRVGLERLAGSCYGFAESEYARLIGQKLRYDNSRMTANSVASAHAAV